jgi:major inositol transporter-like SP family MFS transporter
MLGVAVLPAIVLGLGMMRMPESPRWLALRGRRDEAMAVLSSVRSEDEAHRELDEIVELTEHRGGWRHLRTAWVKRVFLIGIGIAIVQQITGINSIMYYGTQILSTSGFGLQGALVANVLNGVISVAATFLGIWLLGRIGRRAMLVTGLAGTTGSLLFIGIVSMALGSSVNLAALVLIGMVMFLTFQQGMVSPVTWVLLSEIFPLRIRGLAMGVTVCVLWMVNFAIALVFPSAISAWGVSATFLGFVVLGIAAILLVARFVPETRGLSLEQIEARFEAGR